MHDYMKVCPAINVKSCPAINVKLCLSLKFKGRLTLLAWRRWIFHSRLHKQKFTKRFYLRVALMRQSLIKRLKASTKDILLVLCVITEEVTENIFLINLL